MYQLTRSRKTFTLISLFYLTIKTTSIIRLLILIIALLSIWIDIAISTCHYTFAWLKHAEPPVFNYTVTWTAIPWLSVIVITLLIMQNETVSTYKCAIWRGARTSPSSFYLTRWWASILTWFISIITLLIWSLDYWIPTYIASRRESLASPKGFNLAWRWASIARNYISVITFFSSIICSVSTYNDASLIDNFIERNTTCTDASLGRWIIRSTYVAFDIWALIYCDFKRS